MPSFTVMASKHVLDKNTKHLPYPTVRVYSLHAEVCAKTADEAMNLYKCENPEHTVTGAYGWRKD